MSFSSTLKEADFGSVSLRCWILTLVPLLFSANIFGGDVQLNIPTDSRQALLVSTEDWDASTGSLKRLERKQGGEWKLVGKPIPVSVGKYGMGWGIGVHQGATAGPVKKEGDKKAPAGVFTLGTAFGYAAKAPRNCKFPYRQSTKNDYFVDDVDSPDYNRWVTIANGAARPWRSAEPMLLKSVVYQLGIVVNHNMTPPVRGAGSAIFIHIWSEPGSPTAGCTAMSESNIRKVLKWLDTKANPVLIQGPKGAMPVLVP